MSPKVSVIITAHNYGRFLRQAIESVLTQTMKDFELIIVNDGSTDNTSQMLEKYKNDTRLYVIELDKVGLATAANIGIKASKGKYVIRLDADDYFDESILLVESTILDQRSETGMVFPDYYRVSERGSLLDNVRLMKVGEEATLLDRPPLAAGAMYRRACYDKIGGYNENLKYQEDYDFWIRFTAKFKVYNVNVPLMYYRQHAGSMSHNTEARMAAKSFVKKRFVEDNGFLDGKKILCVIPVVAESRLNKYLCLNEVNNKPLMAYIIEEAKKIDMFDTIILDTEDPKISEVGKEMGIEVPFCRPIELAHFSTHQVDIMCHLLMKLKEKRDYLPDILVLLHYNYPMTKKIHVEKAIHTMLIHNTDSVLSVSEDLTFHYQPGKYGLKPIVFRQRYLREEKVRTYKESGGIIVVRPENIMKGNLLGKKIGHIVMQPHETIRIETEHDYWIFEQMVKQGWTAKKGL